MRSIYFILQFIFTHPLGRKNKWEAFKRFSLYQISKFFNPYPIVYAYTDKTKLIIEKGMTGATGNIYCGLHEFEDMSFLLHFLRPEDLFVDVGSNIGSYTVLASGHIGCKTIAFEPVPSTYDSLKNNISINHLENKVTLLNLGVGSERDVLRFTSGLDTVNHVALPGEQISTIDVQVDTLDSQLHGKSPILLKIDVEGFETQVLKGAGSTLRNSGLQALIIELNGSGTKYGFTDEAVHQELLTCGFRPYAYNAFERKLSPRETYGTHNTIYIRNREQVMHRLEQAEAIKMLGQVF